MGQALYRKHRSKNLAEIVGQDHITTALNQALSSGRISHAYLFTGPHGTGKTSIARILAYAVNGLEYSTEPHLDIIEIDAASNRRIDEIRDLREKVYVAPSSAKYKVYIIDEVHMLTREAFNALLKTLEEPPAHVIFILATTDAHKLPETIISRTQRYNFRPVEQAKVISHLKHIAQQEDIAIEDEALALLAEHGEGSFRDSISMLDQAGNNGQKVTAHHVRQQLGIPPIKAVAELLQSLQAGSVAAPVKHLQAMYEGGYRAPAIAEQLSHVLRTDLTNARTTLVPQAALSLLKNLLDVASAHNPDRYLELILMQASTRPEVAVNVPPQPSITVADILPPVQSATQITAKSPPPQDEKSSHKSHKAPPPVNDVVPQAKGSATSTISLDDEAWKQVLAELKKQYNTIYGIVRMAETDFSEAGKITLGFGFAFHQKRIHDAKNRKIVMDTIAQVTGQHIELVCVIKQNKTPTKAVVVPDDALKDISTVFGGGELL